MIYLKTIGVFGNASTTTTTPIEITTTYPGPGSSSSGSPTVVPWPQCPVEGAIQEFQNFKATLFSNLSYPFLNPNSFFCVSIQKIFFFIFPKPNFTFDPLSNLEKFKLHQKKMFSH